MTTEKSETAPVTNPRLMQKADEWFNKEISYAKELGTVGFMARSMVMATMPHSKPTTESFLRENGFYSLAMTAHPKIGLPYGAIPRLLMAWMTTEAVRTQERELILGDSLSDFMRVLGLLPTGGRWGTISRLKEQMRRLFSCSISCVYDEAKKDTEEFSVFNITPVEKAHLLWSPKAPEQATLWKSNILLSQSFFEEITRSSVVFRLEALKHLKASSMAVDLYLWSTYRNSYIKRKTLIPWEGLQMQFGAGYPMTAQGKRDFKKRFIEALKRVAVVYPEVRKFELQQDHLLFVPGFSDIPKANVLNQSCQK